MIYTEKSTLILTHYRCGSTALCDQYSRAGYNNHDEAFVWAKNSFDFLQSVHDPEYQFVAKVMPDQWNESMLAYFRELRAQERISVIRLHRKDIVAQIASIYTAKKRSTWHFTDSGYLEDTVEIDLEMLLEIITNMYSQAYELSTVDIPVDVELCYETLDLSDTQYVPAVKPSNYSTLIRDIEYLQRSTEKLAEMSDSYLSWFR